MINKIYALPFMIVTGLFIVTYSVSHSGALENSYLEDEYIYSLEQTYTKFIQENTGNQVAYLNVSNNNYYNTTIIDKLGGYYSITQEKNNGTWEYQTLKCQPQTSEEIESGNATCEGKTSINPNWVVATTSEPRSSVAWVMLEPITLTSSIIGENKPAYISMTHTIKPGENSNHYLTIYKSNNTLTNTSNIQGRLEQQISSNKYRLILQEEYPKKQKTTIIITTAR